MCIILFAWQQHPRYPLVVAANRDEFHGRATEAATWRGDALCGLDLEAGGTWMGVNRRGTFAAVTNYREPGAVRGERSRGDIPWQLIQAANPQPVLNTLLEEQQAFSGFNALARLDNQLLYWSNRGATLSALQPGLYVLSNGLLDTRWPKTERARQALAQALTQEQPQEALFAALADTHQPDDRQLPDTGVGLEVERMVSSIFIRAPHYGTRASTVLLEDTAGQVTFQERRFAAGGVFADASSFAFAKS